MTPLPLSQSLAHADALIDRARPDFAVPVGATLSGNPYFIDLPAISGGGGVISESAMQVIASLYFNAELEGTFLVAVGEELANARFNLNLTDREAAAKLEALATAMRGDWLDRAIRNQIFARVFGLGHVDPNLGSAAVNQEFEPQFARVCAALATSARDLIGWGAPAGAAMRAAVAVQALLTNLAPRVQGNTLIVAERISNQLRMALEALNHPGLANLFMGRSAWDVVRSVLQGDTPDLQSHVGRAQTGLRLLSWMSAHLGVLQAADGQGVITALQSEPQLQGWAEIWLDAAGIQLPQSGTQYPQPYPQSQPGWLQ